MDEINFEEEFDKIAKEFGDVSDSKSGVTLFDLSSTIQAITDAASYLSEFLSVGLSLPADLQLAFPDELTNTIPIFRAIAHEISTEMHILLCPDCGEENENSSEDCVEDEEDNN